MVDCLNQSILLFSLRVGAARSPHEQAHKNARTPRLGWGSLWGRKKRREGLAILGPRALCERAPPRHWLELPVGRKSTCSTRFCARGQYADARRRGSGWSSLWGRKATCCLHVSVSGAGTRTLATAAVVGAFVWGGKATCLTRFCARGPYADTRR